MMRSILRSDLMIIKTLQNVHKICFRGVLVTFTCEVKFDLIKFEPHYVKFFFFRTSSIVKVFDILTFDK